MDERTFRKAMSKFATGVTVVTTVYEKQIYGMTVNAFMSLSLNPKLVAVSIGKSTGMNERLTKIDQIGISILTEDQQRISMHFAKQLREPIHIPFLYLKGIPVIDGALATLACDIKDLVEAGDHRIVIAEVQEINIGEGKPLIYFNRAYEQLSAHTQACQEC